MSLTFRAYRFFKIHDLTDSKKLTTGVISFDDLALDWYQAQEELEVFKNWADLKERMLVQFRSIREGTLVGRFFSIKQKMNVEDYRNRFDRYLALVAFLQTVVLEETLMIGLSP